MLTSTEAWRRAIDPLLPEEAIPTNPDLGVRYPWRELAVYSLTRQHQARVEQAKRIIANAPSVADLGWYLAVSGGKDSMACATLVAEMGGDLPAMCALRPSVDYPGKAAYVGNLCTALGHTPHLLYPANDSDDLAKLVAGGISLLDNPNIVGKAMHDAGMWGSVGDWLAVNDFSGVILGLRAGESRGRKMNRRMRGTTYERKDRMHVCCPLSDWSAYDVHAYLLSKDIPLLPLYLCVDPGDNGMRLREDTCLSGGWAANLGSYTWLRRWWPAQWEAIAAADPRVRDVS